MVNSDAPNRNSPPPRKSAVGCSAKAVFSGCFPWPCACSWSCWCLRLDCGLCPSSSCSDSRHEPERHAHHRHFQRLDRPYWSDPALQPDSVLLHPLSSGPRGQHRAWYFEREYQVSFLSLLLKWDIAGLLLLYAMKHGKPERSRGHRPLKVTCPCGQVRLRKLCPLNVLVARSRFAILEVHF